MKREDYLLLGAVGLGLLAAFGAVKVAVRVYNLSARAREILPKVWYYARNTGIDPFIFAAIVAKESSFNPDAYRAEPGYRWVGDWPNPDVDEGDASYGLVQILYSVAAGEVGYRGEPSGLFDPDTNLHLGANYFRKLLARFNGNYQDAIAAYNSGRPLSALPEGHVTRVDYVPKVEGYAAYFQQENVFAGLA